MINQYQPNKCSLSLMSDLAGEFPLYLYWPQDKSTLLYSKSINELLNSTLVAKPLEISNEGLSFLLQSGVVPPPKTVYQNIYILGIGDKAEVSTINGKINIEFSHQFPFMNANRLSAGEMYPDEELILQMLAKTTINSIDESKPSFLFHSAGKDSNSIALALAKAGMQDGVTLVTHKSKGKLDESEISKSIAKKLGFSHRVLHEVDVLADEHLVVINNYFKDVPFPCVDDLSLAYPLYSMEIPELINSNVIFGDGNDSHMISPPEARDPKMLRLLNISSKFSFLRKVVNSESMLNSLLRTPSEWFGLSGFSLKDSKLIYPDSISVYQYWREETDKRSDWDLFDFKSDIYSTRVITEKMIRKLFNFTSFINANIILPFANDEVATYFSKMPEKHLFDRDSFKNKIVLRDLLKSKLDLDSDSIGKMGWSYDTRSIIEMNWELVVKEILDCTLWNNHDVQLILSRLKRSMDKNSKYSQAAGRLVYRLYLLSMWKNKCKYINNV